MCVVAPLVPSSSINTPTNERTNGWLCLAGWTANRRLSVRALTSERALVLARSRLYRYFCSGLSFLSGVPLLHPTMVYLKCHEGEGVHTHAPVCNAQSDVSQQAVTGFTPALLPNRLRIYAVYVHTYAYTQRRARWDIHAFVHTCARVYVHHECSQRYAQVLARRTHA